MPFRKIPRKFDCPGIVEHLKSKLLYSDDIDSSAIATIAEIMGIEKRTVYATLDGHIKLSLDFLHAATIATDGHPEIAKYLAPDGFSLKKDIANCEPDKATLAEECLDDVPALARFHLVLSDPSAKEYRVAAALNDVVYELQQNLNKWKQDHESE